MSEEKILSDVQYVENKKHTEEEKLERLQRILSMCEEGWKIVIIRTAPSWCRGHLESFTIYDPESQVVDPEYIIKKWGGHSIHIKVGDEKGKWLGGGTLNLFTYPPKRNGKIIKESEIYDYDDDSRVLPSNRNTIYPLQPVQAQPSLDFGRLLDFVGKNKPDLASIVKLIDYFRGSQQQVVSQNPLDQMMSTLTLFREMKSMFGEFGGELPQENNSETEMMKMFASLAGNLLASKQRPEPARLSPPPRPSAQISPPNPNQNVTPQKKPDTMLDLAQAISSLGAAEAADVVSLALSNMSPEKQQAYLTEFLESWNDSSDDDENQVADYSGISNNDDIDGRIRTNSGNQENTRRTAEKNARNDPFDRSGD